jgi:mono/diheme cytochrome c family protein
MKPTRSAERDLSSGEIAISGGNQRPRGSAALQESARPGPALLAVAAVAATYVYFLVFAEFALLELAAVRAREWPLRAVMAVLGVGGVLGSVAAAWGFRAQRVRAALAGGFVVAALGAGVVWAARRAGIFVGGTALVGFGLGWLTVTLAAGLRAVSGGWLGRVCGLGTGLAYALCNVPAVFAASAETQTVLAGVVALGGAWAARGWALPTKAGAVDAETDFRREPLAGWLVVLLALVWMDSAAFYVIQHTAVWKGAMWSGEARLWGNVGVHLVAAVLAGWALDRGWAARVAAVAGGCLLGACALLSAGKSASLAVALYTGGVSLYSTLLVWYPASTARARVAAIVFAVAGWGGSALGIGMAQDLAGIPAAFVVIAALAIAGGLWWRRRLAAIAAMLMLASGLTSTGRAQEEALVARGREVYVAEGCLHCHSQYVRPNVRADVERWGPARSLAETKAERPPLLGNRRQGPDLATVGARRSGEWQRLHLQDPQALVTGSRMPAYAHLFAGDGERGAALVAYLNSLGTESAADRWVRAAVWRPEAVAATTMSENPPPRTGRELFAQWCAACHGAAGRGDGALATRLSVRPPDWWREPWRRIARDEPDVQAALARIIKFGLPGSPMAGHEYFSDAEIVSLAREVASMHAPKSDPP